MTENKLRKYLRRPFPSLPSDSAKAVKHIVLSDSKAGYLKSQFTEQDQVNVTWWFRSGARTHEQLRYAEWKLVREFERETEIILYCWLGTCDLTCKSGKFINLRFAEREQGVSFLTDRLRCLLALSDRFPGLRVVLLEVPPISISEWNPEIT